MIKICGITDKDNAKEISKLGINALGYVFYEKSPRFIEVSRAKEIISSINPFIKNVALFVNVEPSYINEVFEETKFDIAQIHFDVSDSFLKELKCPYIRVVRVKEKKDLLKYSNEYRLVDAFVENYGGSGKSINFKWFEDIDCSRIIIAGGLNEENVKELKKFNFAGYDVSSSVEVKKGYKDIKKVKRFIEAIKGLS